MGKPLDSSPGLGGERELIYDQISFLKRKMQIWEGKKP